MARSSAEGYRPLVEDLEWRGGVSMRIKLAMDFEKCPAVELAALHAKGREIEVPLDECSHPRGGRVFLRSKTSELVGREFYGIMPAYLVVRALMNGSALRQNIPPD